jgi:hypothetical protein
LADNFPPMICMGEIMNTSRRAAGFGLLAFGIGTPFALIAYGVPGGKYSEAVTAKFISSGHMTTVLISSYVGAFAALGFLVFANRMRHELRSGGDFFWALAVAGTTSAVIGYISLGSIAIDSRSIGSAVTVPHSVIHLVAGIALEIVIGATTLFLGIATILLAARSTLPSWLRVATYLGGVGGLLSVLFDPQLLFWLWAIIFGIWAIMDKASGSKAAVA